MKIAWIQLGGAASAAVLALLMTAPVKAAEAAPGMKAVAAEELDKRSKQAQQAQEAQGGGEAKGLSDSSVRILVTYAFSIIPDQVPGPDGKPVKVNKSDPNKFVIPVDDARRVIRAATRSAYAEACGLPELAAANFEAMIKAEKDKKSWSPEQIMMVEALHLFATSYFTGNAAIVDDPAPGQQTSQADGKTPVSKGDSADEQAGQPPREVKAPPPPKCPPEQKEKVTNAINAYVQAQAAGTGQ